ncbi:hypothetical protein PACTADRAFT_184864 [Pachysolen tannophilus NRRL Y-2460]|uniref:Protein farnesyltransferase subunit beta n=1 Tax=Pachysolen tannophilus NRRL Y-2460 TaxID=669874 RepID=A0A1E4U3G2_PACTA|nr:hypothetical protein PACTADRAFT_184864 [Pachysolen tannophilus NRRL Y-2460]
MAYGATSGAASVAKLDFLLNLIGKTDISMMERDNFVQDNYKSINFDTLIEMLDKETVLKDSLVTKTSIDQDNTENLVREIYEKVLEKGEPLPTLKKKAHLKFLNYVISSPLPEGYTVLDASHPWLIYWCCNSIKMLDQDLTLETKRAISNTVLSFVNTETGGIGGGLNQLGHIAATYASVCSLALSEDEESWLKIDRKSIYNWIMNHLKQPDGSFIMSIGGEKDTRAVYCTLCVASLLNIITPELIENTANWLSSCQTFEGGFAGTPQDEAHGGYTFCAVASFCILGEPSMILPKYCNLDSLIRWTCMRQYQLEGGLSGRTNKLVDGCYSHWVGSIVPFLEMTIKGVNKELISRAALQNYILNCCQLENESGGLRDKPGKSVDFYHTNYVLCGLSILQHKYFFNSNLDKGTIDSAAYCYNCNTINNLNIIEIKSENQLNSIDPIFGLPLGIANSMKDFFVNLDS